MDAFETLYRRHAAAVLRFAWGLCGDRNLAEDIVSETFVRILTKAPRIRTQTALAYLLITARNVHLAGARRRRREVPLSEDIPASENDLDGHLDDLARLRAVLGGLRAVPEGERAAFLLRVNHELSYEEISVALGISVTAAKVRVHRARMRLAETWESEGRTS